MTTEDNRQDGVPIVATASAPATAVRLSDLVDQVIGRLAQTSDHDVDAGAAQLAAWMDQQRELASAAPLAEPEALASPDRWQATANTEEEQSGWAAAAAVGRAPVRSREPSRQQVEFPPPRWPSLVDDDPYATQEEEVVSSRQALAAPPLARLAEAPPPVWRETSVARRASSLAEAPPPARQETSVASQASSLAERPSPAPSETRQSGYPEAEPSPLLFEVTFGRWAAVRVRLGLSLTRVFALVALTVVAVVAMLNQAHQAILILGGLSGGYLALVGAALLGSFLSGQHDRRAHAYSALQLLLGRDPRQVQTEQDRPVGT